MRVTYEEVLGKLEQIVASKPADYKYAYDPKAIEVARLNPMSGGYGTWTDDSNREYAVDCFYRFTDDLPGCIIGHLLYAFDPDHRAIEGQTAYTEVDALLDVDNRTKRLLTKVQEYQDANVTWREALDQAIADVN